MSTLYEDYRMYCMMPVKSLFVSSPLLHLPQRIIVPHHFSLDCFVTL